MTGGYKVVVCTPAGRQRYMKVLAPRLLSDPDVDRWDVWVNTANVANLSYLRGLSQHPKVRLVEVRDPVTEPLSFRIHKFFAHATDGDSVYLRLDDDIVWYSPGSIRRVVERRLDDPHPFLVYGNVLNSGLTSYHHQMSGRIPRSWGDCAYECMDKVSWGDPQFAVKLHGKFLDDPDPVKWHLPDHTLADYERHSINAISWTGKDAQAWAREVSFDEEAWLSHIAPRHRNRPNVTRGDTLFCHYAFYTQRDAVDCSNVLQRYADMTTPYDRLESTAANIDNLPLELLTDPASLAGFLANAGLFNDGVVPYGRWQQYCNKVGEPGLWQHPVEFASLLVRVARDKPARVLDLGTFHGFGSVLMSSYFRRFNPEARVTAADWHRWITDPNPAPLKRIDYYPHTHSGHYSGMEWDFVFIDADHNYDAAITDYGRLKGAKLLAFHDVADHSVRDRCPNQGVYRLWRELKDTRPHEEFVHAEPGWMGIGLLT